MTPLVPAELMRRALALVRTQRALGERLEMSKARISRVVHGARLSVANCLRLAVMLNEDPAIVLRAYRYAQLGAILQFLYTTRGCVPRERARVHEALDRLQSDDCRFVGNLIDRLAVSGMTETPTAESIASGLNEQKGGAR